VATAVATAVATVVAAPKDKPGMLAQPTLMV
jgi:hypothetical protein